MDVDGVDTMEEEEEMLQEDSWTIIHAYFDEKGLVRQQLDSFDEFVLNTIQEMVDDAPAIVEKVPEVYEPGHASANSTSKISIKFGQTYLSHPVYNENDVRNPTGTAGSGPLMPNEARLRNLT